MAQTSLPEVDATAEAAANQALLQPTEYDYVPTAEDLGQQRIRLAQMLTPEVVENKVRGGQWLVPGVGATDEVEIQVQGMRRTRERGTRDNEDRRRVLCASPDGVRGFGDPGVMCAGCPYAQWTPGSDGKNKPPECTLAYRYRVTLVGGGMGELTLSTKSAAQVAGQLNSFVAQAAAQNGGAYPSGAVVARLGSQLQQKGSRRYFIPTLLGAQVVPMSRLNDGSIEVSGRLAENDEDDEPAPVATFRKPAARVEDYTAPRQEPTPKQIKYLWAIATESGLGRDDIDKLVAEAGHENIEDMSRVEVSLLIEQIQGLRVDK